MDIGRHRHRLELPIGAVAGVTAAALALAVDHLVELPVSVSSANASALLAASFGALVTAGAFAFWMLPVAAQFAAAAVPSPAVANHLHDRFQRRVIATTLGALSYIAVTVLALPAQADAPAPVVATIVAGGLGVAALGALVVAIEHAVRSTRPSALISEAAHQVIDRIRRSRSASTRLVSDAHDRAPHDDGTGIAVTAPATGWLADVDDTGLLHELPPHSSVAMEVGVGSFVVRGWTRIATVRGCDEPADDLGARLGRHFTVADERSADRDLVSSLTRFTDIAVHAGTGSSGSPSTVYEAIWYLGAILHELVDHELGVVDRQLEDGRALEWVPDPGAAVLAGVAVDRLRQVIASQPTMALELVRVLADARRHAERAGREDLAAALDEQADLTVAQCRHADPLPADLARVAAMRDDSRNGRGAEREEEYPTEPPEGTASR